MISKKRLVVYAITAYVLLFQSLIAQAKISGTEKNNSQIESIKSMVEAIEKGFRSNRFEVVKQSSEYEGRGDCLHHTFVLDSNRIVKYVRGCGSDDSALSTSFYYDSNSVLRYVIIFANAVVGTRIEHTIYFDEAGVRILENHKLNSGPDYPFSEAWADENMVRNPMKVFKGR